MDINKLLKSGMRACGRVLRLLPKEGETGIGSPREYMLDVLRSETLPSLDILYPMLLRKDISTGLLIPYGDNESHNDIRGLQYRVMSDDRYLKFRIPLEVTDGYEIHSIKSCVPIHHSASSIHGISGGIMYGGLPYGNQWGRTSSADLYGAALSSMIEYADKQLLGTIKRNFRFYFFPPNILSVTEAGSLNITFCLKNDENLLSVDDMAYDGVKSLFILDLKASIFNEYGNYTEVSTPSGDFDLKISSWESAESERNELYKELRSKSHFRRSSIRS